MKNCEAVSREERNYCRTKNIFRKYIYIYIRQEYRFLDLDITLCLILIIDKDIFDYKRIYPKSNS